MISTPDERVWRLSELDLFADLTQDEMDRIGAAAPMRQVGRGELLYGPHRPAEVLFILKAGRVRLYRTAADGRSLTTSIVLPGELFGAMPTLAQRMQQTFAEVLDSGVVCVMTRHDVERLLLTDLRIVTRITEALGARIGELERRLSDTVLLPVPARICSTLATLAGSPPVSVRLTTSNWPIWWGRPVRPPPRSSVSCANGTSSGCGGDGSTCSIRCGCWSWPPDARHTPRVRARGREGDGWVSKAQARKAGLSPRVPYP